MSCGNLSSKSIANLKLSELIVHIKDGYLHNVHIPCVNSPKKCASEIYTRSTGKLPIPSITTSTAIPGFTGRAPIDVPQAITSPGFNVIS